jgi:hypothetical protein
VWAAYPDLSLEVISMGDTGGGFVATQWVLHGTHTGPFLDLEASATGGRPARTFHDFSRAVALKAPSIAPLGFAGET